MPVTKYVWDVTTDSYLMETDENDVTTAVYTNEPGQFGPVISQRRGANSNFFHLDALGSVVDVTGAAEDPTDSYVYKAYGEIVATAGSTANPFRWVGSLGYYCDLDLLQYYVRARHYHPALARWLPVDPRGFGAGDVNLYSYVRNKATNRVDPSGLALVLAGGPDAPSDPYLPFVALYPELALTSRPPFYPAEEFLLNKYCWCAVVLSNQPPPPPVRLRPGVWVHAEQGWVECYRGKLIARFLNYPRGTSEAGCGLEVCGFAHEGHHVAQINYLAPGLCATPRARTHRYPMLHETCLPYAECFAWAKHLECLVRLAKSDDWRRRVPDRCKKEEVGQDGLILQQRGIKFIIRDTIKKLTSLRDCRWHHRQLVDAAEAVLVSRIP